MRGLLLGTLLDPLDDPVDAPGSNPSFGRHTFAFPFDVGVFVIAYKLVVDVRQCGFTGGHDVVAFLGLLAGLVDHAFVCDLPILEVQTSSNDLFALFSATFPLGLVALHTVTSDGGPNVTAKAVFACFCLGSQRSNANKAEQFKSSHCAKNDSKSFHCGSPYLLTDP